MNKAMRRDFKMMRAMQAPEGDHNSNWAISYGDMVTLLVAFFLLFFHIGSDSFHVKMIEKAIAESFSPPSEKESELKWGQAKEEAATAFTRMDKFKDIQTTTKGDKLIVEFPSISFFGTAQYELTEDGKVILAKFARVYSDKIRGMRLVVRGFTDNRPVKGDRRGIFKDNLELSVLRALSAVRVLNESGIPLRLMRTGGYGESDKAGDISPDDQLKLDRKIVLVLEPLDKTERGMDIDSPANKGETNEAIQ